MKPKVPNIDLSLGFIILLAFLPIPRVFFHDLHLISFDSIFYNALGFIPFLVWFLVALFQKSIQPFRDFIAIGLMYGLFLAITHQILWDASWGNTPPQLGGNLAGQLSPFVENVILRIVTLISSLLTGLVSGTIFGLIALLASKARKKL